MATMLAAAATIDPTPNRRSRVPGRVAPDAGSAISRRSRCQDQIWGGYGVGRQAEFPGEVREVHKGASAPVAVGHVVGQQAIRPDASAPRQAAQRVARQQLVDLVVAAVVSVMSPR